MLRPTRATRRTCGRSRGCWRRCWRKSRPGAPVARIRTTPAGQAAGVTLASGEEIDADTVITTVHPKIAFLELVDAAVLPEEFLADIRGWQTRSGTVKINLALDRLPVFA